LKSNELTADVDASGNEYFCSFLARPGELIVTTDIKANASGAGVSYELLNETAFTPLLCCDGVQADGSGSGRQVDKLRFAKRQVVILHLTNQTQAVARCDFALADPGRPIRMKSHRAEFFIEETNLLR
jgi:hypothetical protein